jgi:hypothetical protein
MLEPLLYFGATVLATVTVALLVCRYRSARQKRISWGTVFMSSLAANASVFFGLGIYEEGWDTFTLEAWSGGKGGLAGLFVVLGVITVLCLLPALGVAIYYQRRSKRDEKQTV